MGRACREFRRWRPAATSSCLGCRAPCSVVDREAVTEGDGLLAHARLDRGIARFAVGCKTVEHFDDYSGTKVADPYRWLEELDSPDTKAWVAAQNALTDSVVDAFPERTVIKQRLTELWNYSRTGLPFKEANWYFYTKNDGLQNQSPLYVTDGLHGAERLLLDPNQLSAIAAERKPRMFLLPYGIPIAIGTIFYFVMTGMLI